MKLYYNMKFLFILYIYTYIYIKYLFMFVNFNKILLFKDTCEIDINKN